MTGVQTCALPICQRKIDDCHGLIAAELKFAENEIFMSIAEMNKQIKRTSFAAGQDPWQGPVGAASDSLGPLASAFYKDVKSRLDDAKTLYATYMKYSQSKPTWADNW